jgi:DNA-directed RNA polymerase specialized sigma24 family protein
MAIDLRTMMMALIAGPAGAAEALVLRHFEGLQLDEIAARMGLSRATVKRRIESAEAWLEIVRARDLP